MEDVGPLYVQVSFRIEDDLLTYPVAVDSYFEACIAHGIVTTIAKLGHVIDHYMERYLRKTYDKHETIDRILSKHPNVAVVDDNLCLSTQPG